MEFHSIVQPVHDRDEVRVEEKEEDAQRYWNFDEDIVEIAEAAEEDGPAATITETVHGELND